MFEEGRSYEIRWLEGDDETSSTFEVIAWEAPLLKCRGGNGAETIFNTGSRSFVRASILGHEPSTSDFGELRIDRTYR